MTERWNPHLRMLLVKIAIRDDAQAQQIRNICCKMGLRYDDKPLVEVSKPPPTSSKN